jgi:hypothetical protein
MTTKRSNQNPVDYQSDLPEQSGAGVDVSNPPGDESGELYRALMADLEAIAEAARQLFPDVEPPDEVWEHIELAIKGEEGK